MLAQIKGHAVTKRQLPPLSNVSQIVNPAVGDSLSNLLLVASILKQRCLTPSQWAAMFTPLSSRLATLRVADRHAIVTEQMETIVVKPAGLQKAIDEAVVLTQGRSFVRPSGTEDVVRVYAEAKSRVECDRLCLLVVQAVHDLAGGVGPKPQTLQ
jgi:phosphoacetylglucosamine mutase